MSMRRGCKKFFGLVVRIVKGFISFSGGCFGLVVSSFRWFIGVCRMCTQKVRWFILLCKARIRRVIRSFLRFFSVKRMLTKQFYIFDEMPVAVSKARCYKIDYQKAVFV